MNNSNVIYPYRQNVGIMKKFFSKPIVLLLAVANCLLIVAGAVTGLVFDSGNLNLLIFTFPAINAIAFFLFYFNGKSNKPVVSFNASIILLKIISILSIVVEGIGIIAFLFLTLVIPATPILTTMFPNSFLMLLAISFPTLIASLLQSIAMLIMLGSFKKSTTSVYLYKNGSIFTVVTTAVLFFASAICSYLSILYMPDIMSQVNTSISEMIASLPQSVYSEIPQTSAMTQTFTYSSVVTSVIQLIIYVLTIIFALSYNKYISKLSDSYNNSVAPTVEQPVANVPTAPQNIQNGVQNIKQPVNFNPQPVFKNDNEVPPQNSTPTNQNENPYVALWKDAPSKNICPGCGFECPDGTLFCGNCGTKLK